MLEPLFDMHEVGVQGALIARVDHPNDEKQLEQSIEVAPKRSDCRSDKVLKVGELTLSCCRRSRRGRPRFCSTLHV